MSESPSPSFQRDCAAVLAARLGEPRRAWPHSARSSSRSATLLVGGDGIPVKEFLSRPVADWLQS